jgi:DNA helicase II / ATP-dependent DNA helicase PcrA
MENEYLGLDFIPSPYQKKIFNFILHGNGNAVISARAGSGKTSTCVESMKLINPKYKVMFLAFNKSIADELSEKLKDYRNVEVRTSHSLGLAILNRNVEGEIELDDYKYRGHLKENISELSNITDKKMTKAEYNNYIDNITELIDFARYNLAQSAEEVKRLAFKYDIPLISDECEVTVKMLEWGKTVLNRIDFTDMVWLPVECSMSTKGFQKDFIYFDEAQDASQMSVQLFLKCFKRGSRFIVIGDENQAINQFAGSSDEAFDYLKNYPKTTLFTLPICYRCPTKIVDLAQRFVPDIQAKEGAIEGDVVGNCYTSMLKSGDMVICRSKTPLVMTYTKLLRKGIPCYIKGQEFGVSLKKMVEDINIEDLNISLKEDGVFVRLYDNLFDQRNKLMLNGSMDYQDATLSSYITNLYDMIKTLEILGTKYNTKTELISHIDEMFNETEDGVMLSTIHKAKGLEADNVYMLCSSSMPSKLAKKEWEMVAEQNLIYVAYTRAKKKLGFISENEIRPYGISQGNESILKELGIIETLVCRTLGKEPMSQENSVDVARFNLHNGLTQIEEEHKDDKCASLMGTECQDDDLLKELDGLL